MKKTKEDTNRRNHMESKRFRKKQISSLKWGKVKPLGFFEGIALKYAGYRDGKLKLPAKEGDTWRSPFLDEEVSKYHEFCFRMWGRLQLAVEDSLTRVNHLMKSIPQTEQTLANARKVLTDEGERIRLCCRSRRKGEENLTDEQVNRRREKELSSHLLSLQGKVHMLEKTLEQETAELFFLRSNLQELEQSTGMICRRVLEHTKLRAAAYWNAAMKYQSGDLPLPMTPGLEINQKAESAYRLSSARLLGAAEPEYQDEKEAS